jgi:hypothetical protein
MVKPADLWKGDNPARECRADLRSPIGAAARTDRAGTVEHSGNREGAAPSIAAARDRGRPQRASGVRAPARQRGYFAPLRRERSPVTAKNLMA